MTHLLFDDGEDAFAFLDIDAYWAAVRRGNPGLERDIKPPPQDNPECGTLAGVRHHVQAGEALCERCESARASYRRSWARDHRRTA